MSTDAQNNKAGEQEPRRGFPVFAIIPLVIFGVLVVLFLTQLLSGNNPQELPSALLNKPSPEFSAVPVEGLLRDGQQIPGISNESFKDKVTVFNVFGSWCGPCRAEHEYLMDLSKDPRIQMAGLNYKDKPLAAIRFLKDLGNPYDLVGADSGRIGIEWGVYGVPETFIVDGQGNIRYKFIGPLTATSYRDVFLPELEKVISQTK
ncbi:DsbE family thiol:disulfide interchange protein [Flexibacterium corallicola]|uniref:DsbE family thiol:disulfide interchange protein n=1 Tax=Flexibacterium corallicola TaxID=3037259 RepID=UPI00286F57B9|nr:DsbE family thiol:disulfide interchange protein [Pseudovibrio sp. M1P-2-3]